MYNNSPDKTLIFHKAIFFPDRWSLAGHNESIQEATVCKAHLLPQSSKYWPPSVTMQLFIFARMKTDGCREVSSTSRRASSSCLSPTITWPVMSSDGRGTCKRGMVTIPINNSFQNRLHSFMIFDSYGSSKAIK